MKIVHRPVLVRLCLAACLAAALSETKSAAGAKVEELVLGPVNAGGLYTLAPAGGHAAYMGRKGAMLYIAVDGVEGPEFNEIYKAAGGGAFFPEKAGVWPGTLGGLAGHDAPVLYSPDGLHYAYAGTQGKEYVVIHDGKEIGRGAWELMGRRGLTMSPTGRHVYWTEARMEQGRTIARTIMTGKPGPWTFGAVEPAFSGDDAHYAYFLSRTLGSEKALLVLDGKDAGYVGGQPQFTADGSTLLTLHNDAVGNMEVLANGKPATSNFSVTKIFAAPVGKRWAAIGRVPGSRANTLFVDGKLVPGSDDVETVWFSPDGRRYAALCHNYVTQKFAMIVDGSRVGYARVDAVAPYWTPDSSRVIYTAATDTESVVVVDNDAYGYKGNFSGMTIADQGNRYAWVTADNGTRSYSVVVGDKSVLPSGVYPMSQFTFSPDGSRYAYLVGPVGRGEMTGVVLDGALQPGIAPGLFGRWVNAVGAPPHPVAVFSPDSRHAAFIGRSAGINTNSLYLDGKAVAPAQRAIFFPTFTPDGNHLIWASDVQVQPPQPMLAVYVDGQEALRANGYFFQQLPGSWHMDENGVVTFLAADGDSAKRYRITPSADTSVATLLATGVAVAAAPMPAKAAAPAPRPAPARSPAPIPPAPRPVAVAAAPAANAPALTWNDLVRRPEARPTSCTINRDYKFQGGNVVRAGTRVNALEFKPASIVVGTLDGRTNFEAKPDETDALAVAQAAWASLTPPQRNLSFPALLRRTDLWPYHVKLLLPFELEGRSLRVGDQVTLLGIEGNQLLVRLDSANLAFNVAPNETDLMAQARVFLGDESIAAGRLLEELAGKLVNPRDLRPVALDASARPKYVVMYRGAGWCGPCQAFSPQLVKVLQDKAASPAEVTTIYVSADNTPAEMKAYVTKLGISWPTLRYDNKDQLPAFSALFGDAIPQLVVTDRHGKVLIDSAKVGQDRALSQLRELQM